MTTTREQWAFWGTVFATAEIVVGGLFIAAGPYALSSSGLVAGWEHEIPAMGAVALPGLFLICMGIPELMDARTQAGLAAATRRNREARSA